HVPTVGDKLKAGDKAKAIAGLAEVPHLYIFGRISSVRISNDQLEKHGLARTEITDFRALQAKPQMKYKRYFGSQAEVMKAFEQDLAAANLAKMTPMALQKLVGLAQVSVNTENIYDFSRATGLADAGLLPEQIRKLWTELADIIIGTEDEFVKKLQDICKEASPNAPVNASALKKIAATARIPITYPYSKELTFEQDRVIQPEFLDHIRTVIHNVPPGERVPITWDEWMAFSKPNHGARSNVRADGTVTAPISIPLRPIAPRIESIPDLLGPVPERPELLQLPTGP
ncbi:MAG TPA: hypothetical protein VGZ47_16635, partial [Gemmataceae bacterium]|nr:hypothetical protein [Gemmataceae bacterium]